MRVQLSDIKLKHWREALIILVAGGIGGAIVGSLISVVLMLGAMLITGRPERELNWIVYAGCPIGALLYVLNLIAEKVADHEQTKKFLQRNWYTNQEAPEAAARASPAVAMTEDNRQKAEERKQHVSNFAIFIEQNPNGIDIWDVHSLPHNKKVILDAICLEIISEDDDSRVEALKVLAMCLAYFQDGVGNKPLSLLGVDLTSLGTAPASDEDINKLAAQIVDNPDTDHYEGLQPLVQRDEQEILAKLISAERIRREMPEDRKRAILG